MNYKKILTDLLFETDAVKVAPEGELFWYTSGKPGPYYVNTHFLYGSGKKANELLKVIDKAVHNPDTCSETIYRLVSANYQSDRCFRTVIDLMTEYAESNIGIDSFDCISGGERRDWFFSLMIAELLNKPHITIYKDTATSVFHPGEDAWMNKSIKHSRVLHIADLINVASSYERAWIPAVKSMEANLVGSLVVLDRLQGGRELLAGYNIQSNALACVDIELFNNALEAGYICKNQYDVVKGYIEDPYQSIRGFLIDNPNFLNDSLRMDEKTSARAKICINDDLYNLKNR